MIMENVWGYRFESRTNAVESQINRLRDKVDKDFSSKLIHSVRGVGYMIRAEA
jgi:DNA-binding response OmpR family regulator